MQTLISEGKNVCLVDADRNRSALAYGLRGNLKFNIVAMVNKNIIKIRKKLDKLDQSLLQIIEKRTKLIDIVIKNKKYKKDIIDKKRISVILKKIKIKSKNRKIDPKITHKIWSSMIKAYIDYEYRNFKKK